MFLKIKIVLFQVLLSFMLIAQDKIPELITDRPDQTESSTVVPFRSLQVESGFVVANNKSNFFNEKYFAYNTTLFRYGLFNNFELRLGLEYLGEEITMKNAHTPNSITGLSPLYAGFKVAIAEEKDWKPEIAFLGAMILPFTANEGFKSLNPAPNMRFAFSHTLSDRFSLGYNLGAEWDGNTPVPGYFYSLALGIGLTEKLGMYVEGFGLLLDKAESEHLFDAGFTYLLSPNFQFDISGGIGLNDYATDNFISFGFTYRILAK